MNMVAPVLFWCVVQVTLLSLVAGGAYLFVRRSSAAASRILSGTLLMVIVLTALSMSPWPRRWSEQGVAGGERVSPPSVVTESERARTGAEKSAGDRQEREHVIAGDGAAEFSGELLAEGIWLVNDDKADRGWIAIGEAWQGMAQGLERPAVVVSQAHSEGRSWPRVVVGLLLIGPLLGMLRLGGGLAALWVFRRRSRPIDDASLQELLDVLRAELGCRKSVELRVSARIGTPATVGWRRPLILLPSDWTTWDERQRRVVLAHELAHILRWDFLTSLVSQIGVVLHFYHPLVHWLNWRLRLEQELAADALAAPAAGGQRAYLRVLADMTLQQHAPSRMHPAQAFLPSRGNFMRRIEMLRDQRVSQKLSVVRQGAAWAVLSAAGLLILGLRGPSLVAEPPGPEAVQGKQGASAEEARNEQARAAEFDLSYVAADAVLVAGVRPAAFLNQAGREPLVQFVDEHVGLTQMFQRSATEIEQIVYFQRSSELGDRPLVSLLDGPGDFPNLVIRFSAPVELQDAIATLLPPHVEIKKQQRGNAVYHSVEHPISGTMSFFQPNDRTVVISPESWVVHLIDNPPDNGEGFAKDAPWFATWQTVEGTHAAVLFHTVAIRERQGQRFWRGLEPLGLIGPIWERTASVAAGITSDERLTIRSLAASDSPEGAEAVQATTQALLTLAKNWADANFEQFPQSEEFKRLDEMHRQHLMLMIEIATELLKNATIERDDQRVWFETGAKSSSDQFLRLISLPVRQSQIAAMRTVAQNHLRQIGLAFHSYHDIHGRFPPAVLTGPDGETPYSWRVELLPLLVDRGIGVPRLPRDASDEELRTIWHQAIEDLGYRMNEPWESEHNRKFLAEKMPDVYRHPLAEGDSTSAAFFALVGGVTVFPNGEGSRMIQIRDGTSFTIMLVEAKREIPWTKPEDIPYDPEEDLPEFGLFDGGFLALFADGSVRFISENIDEQTLRSLFTRAGAEPVQPF
jgi:hypothetical protein